MTTKTISDLECTRELVRLVILRVIRHADDFQNSDALTALSTAQGELERVGRLLQIVPTMESPAMVMRESLRIVRDKAQCEETSKS